MFSIVNFGTPSRRAIYCVSPQQTQWDARHLTASVVDGTPLATPVILADAVQVKPIPAWLSWVFAPVAFTVPGTIFIGPNTVYIPAELLVHEHVHAYRAQQGAFTYWWSVLSGLVIGARSAIRYGGTIHQWSPIEMEARAAAQTICQQYVFGASLDAGAQVAAYFAAAK